MINLPNECLFKILINLKNYHDLKRYHKTLNSCLLVNRQWCRNAVRLLWSEIEIHGNKSLLRMCLLALNEEEKALLKPFEIMLPNDPKPLFKYLTYTTVIHISSINGGEKWVSHLADYSWSDLAQKIRYSLIKMFLRTSERLKHLTSF
ncbi:f-box domain-containing protein [Gigaspora margarita]|uniref:F-box domain-containing protein n=1 Tax=Gigaspora margarita TaxID=4874 RepID=A0A8H3X9I3_GIGMA|nr:f-box domain-containing protein [Gigaspora margarita]